VFRVAAGYGWQSDTASTVLATIAFKSSEGSGATNSGVPGSSVRILGFDREGDSEERIQMSKVGHVV
jgi:hypothetical protein